MPVRIEEAIKIKNDDNILYNLRLKLVSEKIREKSQDKIIFFKYYIILKILIYLL